MAESGYSGTPLLKKLGIKPGMKLRLINPPSNYFELFEADISAQVVKNGKADIIHVFAVHLKDLDKTFAQLIKELAPDVVIWISWYKRAAKMPTDITEDGIRDIVLPTGWVDVKVCAVNESWSGLKIVKRKVNR